MFDLASYPHIREQIISCLNRPALVNFARTSSSSHRAVIPYLYPTTLFDPLYASSAAEPAPDTTIPDDLDPPTSPPASCPFERVERKLISLLSSPHLARAQTIIVNHPGEWARDMVRLNEKPLPAVRGDGTVTIIRVDAMVPRTKAGHLGSADWEKGTEADREAVRVGKAYYYQALVPVPRGYAVRSDPFPIMATDGRDEYAHFQHLFHIASLLPSRHLILYVPPERQINLHSLIFAACTIYGAPSLTTRRLTILAGSGKHFIQSNISLRLSIPKTVAWDHVELVLVPDTIGNFTYTPPTAWANAGSLPFQAADAARPARVLVLAPLVASIGADTLPSYTVVGVEGFEVVKGDREGFISDTRSCFERVLASSGLSGQADMTFLTLEQWERETSVLAKCAGLR